MHIINVKFRNFAEFFKWLICWIKVRQITWINNENKFDIRHLTENLMIQTLRQIRIFTKYTFYFVAKWLELCRKTRQIHSVNNKNNGDLCTFTENLMTKTLT